MTCRAGHGREPQIKTKGQSMATTVQQILEKKGQHVHSVNEEATVIDAAGVMNDNRIGALVVTSGEKVVGIFTERDILCRIVAAKADPTNTKVREVMTSPVAVCAPTTTRDECRAVMREKRVRHLPVVDEGRLVGMISIGDVLITTHDEQQQTIQYLQEYLYSGR
jgi:CBS domain-containing protein